MCDPKSHCSTDSGVYCTSNTVKSRPPIPVVLKRSEFLEICEQISQDPHCETQQANGQLTSAHRSTFQTTDFNASFDACEFSERDRKPCNDVLKRVHFYTISKRHAAALADGKAELPWLLQGKKASEFSLNSTIRMLDKGVRLKPFSDEEKFTWLHGNLEHGFIRVYDPSSSNCSSVVVPATLTTSSLQICARFNCPPNTLHAQYNGDVIRRLEPYEKPLAIQNDYLTELGVTDPERLQKLGDKRDLGYLIRFYAGRPYLDDGFGQHTLTVQCHVRKGRLFNQWGRRLCILNGTRLIIYPDMARCGEPEIIPLSRSKVEEITLRGRGRSIKITASMPRRPIQTIFLAFDLVTDLNAWLARCVKAAAKVPPISDLSNLQLECLPEQVFCVGSERLLTQLNLRHNSLKHRPPDEDLYVLGWLEDLPRLQSLRCLNLSDNNLGLFPPCLLQLPALTELNLATNRLSEVPPEIGRLQNLQSLSLQNNNLSKLPMELSLCTALSILDVSFNQFTTLPEVLTLLPSLDHWILSGNWIERLASDRLHTCLHHIRKIEMRFNSLQADVDDLIPLGVLSHLTSLDLRDNLCVTTLDLRSLISLQMLHCDRNQINVLQLNGNALTCLSASHNCLKTLIVMPVPQNLKVIDVTHNCLTKLPEWLTELGKIEKIMAGHNKLTHIPHRLFTNVCSLKHLILNHNEIRALPSQVENCFIETFDIHHNSLTALPNDLLASTHKLRLLNLAQNLLTSLPPLNTFLDLNKVQHLVLAANHLTDSAIAVLAGYRRLRVLDLSYNNLKNIDNSCMEKLTCLESLNLSGNRLQCLPPALSKMANLMVLRAHSNQLVSVPDFSVSQSLKVLDVGNNRLRDSLHCFWCPQLKHLDLSCNPDLQLNPAAFHKFEKERMVALIDVSNEASVGPQNKTNHSAPVSPLNPAHKSFPWIAGFSETSGDRNKLCISQIRQSTLKGDAVFGMLDGNLNNEVPSFLQRKLPKIIEDELKHEKDTSSASEYLKYSVITAHRSIGVNGQKLGASCTLCHIRPKAVFEPSSTEHSQYVMNVANVGDTEAVLCRKGVPILLTRKFTVTRSFTDWNDEYERIRKAGGILTEEGEVNGITRCSRILGRSFLFPSVIPDPHLTSVDLTDSDEFLILANQSLWKRMNYDEAVRRIRYIANPILAAKHLQDIGQAYGCSGNLSILVIRLFFNPNMPVPPGILLDSTPLSPSVTSCFHEHPHSIVDVVQLTDSTDTLSTMDEVRSEPQGRKLREKPNYYFEYKRRLKEMLTSESTIYSSAGDILSSMSTIRQNDDDFAENDGVASEPPGTPTSELDLDDPGTPTSSHDGSAPGEISEITGRFLLGDRLRKSGSSSSSGFGKSEEQQPDRPDLDNPVLSKSAGLTLDQRVALDQQIKEESQRNFAEVRKQLMDKFGMKSISGNNRPAVPNTSFAQKTALNNSSFTQEKTLLKTSFTQAKLLPNTVLAQAAPKSAFTQRKTLPNSTFTQEQTLLKTSFTQQEMEEIVTINGSCATDNDRTPPPLIVLPVYENPKRQVFSPHIYDTLTEPAISTESHYSAVKQTSIKPINF